MGGACLRRSHDHGIPWEVRGLVLGSGGIPWEVPGCASPVTMASHGTAGELLGRASRQSF